MMDPVAPQRNLATEVVRRITDEIQKGRLKPGERLPTEFELMEAMGVSRTVVREAISALKADGLVTTRQGAGAFVANDESRVPFRLELSGAITLDTILEVMELRQSVEIEAAALAAERATQKQHLQIRKAVEDMETAIQRGEPAIIEDFQFHQAIASATNNPRFEQFLGFLGRQLIPRQSIRAEVFSGEDAETYLKRILMEHTRIADAIIEGDSGEARRSMRVHLTKAIQRYRGYAVGRTH